MELASGPISLHSEAGAIVTSPFDPGPLAADELLVEQLAYALGDDPAQSVVGHVVSVGAELASEAARWLGRLVAVPRLRACGACLPCRRGHAALCARKPAPSPLASHARIAARLAVAFDAPDQAPTLGSLRSPAQPALLAALSDVGLYAYAAVVRAGVEPNRAAVVLGHGPLALFACAWVRHRGAEAVRASDGNAGPAIAAALAAQGVEPFGVPVIATGVSAEAACALASPGGAVVLCGPIASAPAPTATILARGLSVHGLAGPHPDLLAELCAFVSAGTFDLAPLCRLVDAAEAARLLAANHAGGDDDEDERIPIWVR